MAGDEWLVARTKQVEQAESGGERSVSLEGSQGREQGRPCRGRASRIFRAGIGDWRAADMFIGSTGREKCGDRIGTECGLIWSKFGVPVLPYRCEKLGAGGEKTNCKFEI